LHGRAGGSSSLPDAFSCILNVTNMNTLSNQPDWGSRIGVSWLGGKRGDGGPDKRVWSESAPDDDPDESVCSESEPDEDGPDHGEWSDSELDGRESGWREPGGPESDGREHGEMTYWRRRFIALSVGLGVLSLIAWAFSGTLGASGASGAGGSTAADGGHTSHGHSARATEAEGTAQPGGQPEASPSATAQPSPSVQPSSSASPAAGGAAQAGADAPEQLAAFAPHRDPHPARACKAGNVVITLVVAQDSYGKGQLPQFDVDVVSTGTRTCGFNVGARHLSVVVRAHGKRLWASADCPAGRGGLTTDLVRGVPVIVPFSWDRQASTHACPAGAKQAPAGSYTATASDDGVGSNLVRFTLG
jgi:hypothetical protein